MPCLQAPTGALRRPSPIYGLARALVRLPIRAGGAWLRSRFPARPPVPRELACRGGAHPTLIFKAVTASILREKLVISHAPYGGLLLCPAISTALPSFVLPVQESREAVQRVRASATRPGCKLGNLSHRQLPWRNPLNRSDSVCHPKVLRAWEDCGDPHVSSRIKACDQRIRESYESSHPSGL